jgi:beta-galactosidase
LASYSIASPSAEPFVTFSVLWAIYGSGEIGVGVTAEIKPDSPNFSRFGLEMKMPADNKFVSYYGYGPYSSLYNMKNHCKKGIYQSTVAQEAALQICPHHSVNHFGVQWAVVHDAEGRGIMIKGMPEIGFSAEQDSTNDTCSLLRIDYNQSLDDKLYFYSFTIKPIFTECTDILRESRTLPGIMEA